MLEKGEERERALYLYYKAHTEAVAELKHHVSCIFDTVSRDSALFCNPPLHPHFILST